MQKNRFFIITVLYLVIASGVLLNYAVGLPAPVMNHSTIDRSAYDRGNVLTRSDQWYI